MAGDWKQCEVWNGMYSIDDLQDWHEMRAVKNENERRYQEYIESMRGQQ
jgi:hypothetical protein